MTPAEYEFAMERVDDVLDELFSLYPDRVSQAREKPQFRGWFKGKVMQKLSWSGSTEVIEVALNDRFRQ